MSTLAEAAAEFERQHDPIWDEYQRKAAVLHAEYYARYILLRDEYRRRRALASQDFFLNQNQGVD